MKDINECFTEVCNCSLLYMSRSLKRDVRLLGTYVSSRNALDIRGDAQVDALREMLKCFEKAVALCSTKKYYDKKLYDICTLLTEGLNIQEKKIEMLYLLDLSGLHFEDDFEKYEDLYESFEKIRGYAWSLRRELFSLSEIEHTIRLSIRVS